MNKPILRPAKLSAAQIALAVFEQNLRSCEMAVSLLLPHEPMHEEVWRRCVALFADTPDLHAFGPDETEVLVARLRWLRAKIAEHPHPSVRKAEISTLYFVTHAVLYGKSQCLSEGDERCARLLHHIKAYLSRRLANTELHEPDILYVMSAALTAHFWTSPDDAFAATGGAVTPTMRLST